MKQRLIAAAIHFFASAVVISLFLLLVYFIWYSYPYNVIYSAFDVVKLVAGVDLILGPMLTLVIFNISKPKKELARDVLIIVCFQLVALCWGVNATYKVRPLYAAYYDGTFYTVTGEDVDLTKLKVEIESPGILARTKMVFVKDVDDRESIAKVVEQMNDGGKGLMYSPQRYEPISAYIDEVVERDMGYEYINKVGKKEIIDKCVHSHGKDLSEFLFYPLFSGIDAGKSIVVVDKSTMEIVDVFK